MIRSTDNLARRTVLRGTAGVAALAAGTARPEVVAALRTEALTADGFGVRFDGRSDDAPALQRAVDEAARQGRVLALPPGTATLHSPIDLRGRHVALVGSPTGHTIMKAAASLPCLIDGDELREVIDSPLFLYGLTLDGSGTTGVGLRLRYRHRTVLDTFAVGGCDIGVDETDTWLARRLNCRTRGTRIGWRLSGSNHSSIWQACSFIDAREVHLDIGVAGTARDGNSALLFQACDVEYGAGDGIRIGAGATATFDTCYLGEGIGGDVLRNSGDVIIRGGILHIGYGGAYGIAPLDGTAVVEQAAIAGQQSGALDRLIGMRRGTERPGEGTVTLSGVDTQLRIGGNPVFAGDVLGTMAMAVFAPRLGRAWTALAEGIRIADVVNGDERSVRCLAVTARDPRIGLTAQLHDTGEAVRGGRVYVVVVYTANRPVDLVLTGSPDPTAPRRLLGMLPATSTPATYVKLDITADLADYTGIELSMPASVGNALTVRHVTLSDDRILRPGLVANLAKAR